MFNNKLRFQFNINDSYVTQQRAWYAAYLNALLENPTRPIYDENGNYTEYKVNAERKSKVDDNTAKMQSIKWLGV